MDNKACFFTKRKIIFLVISIFIVLITVLPKVFGLSYIYKYVNYLLPALCYILIISWIYLLVKNKINKRWFIIAITVITILILIIAGPYLLFFSSISGDLYYESVSPSGENRVVVLEDGFIDASYTAYPKVLGVFYKNQDNGYVSKHDHWGDAEINVDWVSDDLASVKIITGCPIPNDGSNENDIIMVSFK